MLSLGEQQRLGHRARAPAGARLPVPGRSHRLARRARRGRALPAAATTACGPRPSSRSATARRWPHSIAAGWRSSREGDAAISVREARWRRRAIIRASDRKRRAAAGSQPPPRDGDSASTYLRLLSVRSAESLAMKAAPHQLEPMPPGLIGVTWSVPVAVVIAGEGVAVALVQVGVVVAQVEREHLPGEAEADVPGVVVFVRDAVGLLARQPAATCHKSSRWCRATDGRNRPTRTSRAVPIAIVAGAVNLTVPDRYRHRRRRFRKIGE